MPDSFPKEFRKRKEIRTFMPRFGMINERRNQLHEVIRLSGMNLIIDDSDPLIIKVAPFRVRGCKFTLSTTTSISNENQSSTTKKNSTKTIRPYGILLSWSIRTVKKLGWAPDVIHSRRLDDFLSSLFIKTGCKDDPMFKNSRCLFFLLSGSGRYNESQTFEKAENGQLLPLKIPNFAKSHQWLM
ncbi:MAG: glycogen/starch synthase [Bacteroidetes bacterium]|nr:glycogen/starch synthase [Bacteroidota bacterium]